MTDELYSVRMHASRGSRHVSGAERIVASRDIDTVLRSLVARALGKDAAPDEIVLKVERLGEGSLKTVAALDVITIDSADVPAARSAAMRVLQQAGISAAVAATAIRSLAQGPSLSGGIMRGALIMDAQSGERLEQDRERGIRASRFDWSERASSEIDRRLAAAGLTHFRTKEALALATKVAHAPGVLAELCWSDEPDYTTGYVASLKTGYIRIPRLKEAGDAKGGRIFFVDRGPLDMDALTRFLHEEAVLISDAGNCRGTVGPEEYFR